MYFKNCIFLKYTMHLFNKSAQNHIRSIIYINVFVQMFDGGPELYVLSSESLNLTRYSSVSSNIISRILK